MTHISCNCIVCAKEYSLDELDSISLSKINTTSFKVCQSCLDKSDPRDDYAEARRIIAVYLGTSKAKQLFNEAKEILKLHNK